MKQKLLEILSQHKQQLSNLHNCITLQQKALVSNDIIAIEAGIGNEETLLAEIAKLQKQIKDKINEIISSNNLPVTQLKLSELIPFIKKNNPDDAEAIKQYIAEISSIASKIVRLNLQNKAIIASTREFIKETVKSLVDTGKDSLLDKRI